jgi:hypothetical protein
METGCDASEIGPSNGLGPAPVYAGNIRHVRSDTLGSNVSATSATEMLPSNPLDPIDAGVFYDAVPLCDEDGPRLGGHADVLLHARRRFSQELSLLRLQWRMWLLCLATGVYGASMVFRNLAFYRYRAGPRLTQDLGFDLLPEWQGYLTDRPMCALQAVLVGACAMSFVPRRTGPPASYAVNIVRRWGMMIAMGNTLRFLTYMSTTLPGSAKHCLPSNQNLARDQSKTARDILFRITVDGVGDGKSGTYNCGDLTFSGHSDDDDLRLLLPALRPQRLQDDAPRGGLVYSARVGGRSDAVHPHRHGSQPLHDGRRHLRVPHTLACSGASTLRAWSRKT